VAYYTQYSQASFIAELAQSLNDPTNVYWSVDELNRALNEALLCWGSLTGYWTARGQFSTVAATPFYDLSIQLPLLRARTYTLGDLTKEIQYHFLEPANGVSGLNMTDQFSIGQITATLKRRRNQFVIDSRLPLTYSTIPVAAYPDGIVDLDQSIALIQRAVWRDAITGKCTPLRRTDTFGSQSYNPSWNLDPGVPFSYSQAAAMPGQMQLIPPPLASGAIPLIYAQTLNLAIADATSLAIPDEFAYAVKYGAMEEALATNSQGYDPIRARYCTERYASALEAAQLQRSLLRASIGNRLLPVGTVTALDSVSPYWQTVQGTPQKAAISYDLLALSKVPNGVYSITCDVCQSAPIPTFPADHVDIGREELPYIFDYCRHILQLKLGGVEFVQSMPLYDNFQRGAQQRTKLIGLKARYMTPLFDTDKSAEEAA
jgi:hypothetical protein